MAKKTFVIDGNNFSDLEGFYTEVQKVLTDDFKEFGRNLDAFNDILRGGFGKFGAYEEVKIVWKNSEKSKKDLGFSAQGGVQTMLAKMHLGKTVFQLIIEMINYHGHELALE